MENKHDCVYSLPLALHWFGAAFALDYTNTGRMEEEVQKKRPDEAHVPDTFTLAGVCSEAALLNSQADITCINPQMAGQDLKTENC